MGGSSTCRRDQAAESGTASAALIISDGSSRMGLQVSTTITFINVSATLFGVEELRASLLFADEAAARLRPVRRMPTHADHAAGTRDTTAAAALSAEACPRTIAWIKSERFVSVSCAPAVELPVERGLYL